ncbi:beta-hydroxyacyl-ACP dehydratase, partial [Gordonia polyisoprenivorans]
MTIEAAPAVEVGTRLPELTIEATPTFVVGG